MAIDLDLELNMISMGMSFMKGTSKKIFIMDGESHQSIKDSIRKGRKVVGESLKMSIKMESPNYFMKDSGKMIIFME